jgi:hypothetical protein
MKLPKEFVLHSLRHTMLSRLGVKPEPMYSASCISRDAAAELNLAKCEVAEAETRAEAVGGSVVPAKSPTSKRWRSGK